MPNLCGRWLSRLELARYAGEGRQLFGVELVTHADGPERGVRVLQFRSGSGLNFDVLVDRAMDLAGMVYRGTPIGWRSPTGFRSPWLHETDAEDGLGWSRSFSGMMNTCGLDHILAPAEESAERYHYRLRSRIKHGLHGRISFTPATLTSYGTRWEGDRCFLYAKGEVVQAAMFAENLLLERTIEVEVGTDTVTYHDRVRNRGFDPTPHALLYHVNLGWPLVDKDTRLVGVEGPLVHFHDPDKTDIGPFAQATPQSGWNEQVYEHEVKPGSDAMVQVGLANQNFVAPSGETGLALEIGYDANALPAFFQWQNFQEGVYVVGLEPATTHAGTREEWFERGEMKILEHAQSADYTLQLTPRVGESAMALLQQ